MAFGSFVGSFALRRGIGNCVPTVLPSDDDGNDDRSQGYQGQTDRTDGGHLIWPQRRGGGAYVHVGIIDADCLRCRWNDMAGLGPVSPGGGCCMWPLSLHA
jgi:hypothetical protein